ncbi:MAG: hypothetical protein SVJ22_05840 [Halobacteriota archaeon]|nr:hypothetical protein [Halobacteriota archaeon]
MSIHWGTDAQVSIDFLAGITIFLVTFIAIALFIPGMFTPFQSETVDLNSVAYRTSVILIEDPGRWNNTTVGGSDWEKNVTTRANLRRIGLAVDKDNPNLLNLSKIKPFNDDSYLNNSELIFNLSLFRRIGATDVAYGFNISIVELDDGTILAERGENISSTSGDVVSMKRTVLAQTGYYAYLNGDNLTQEDPIANTKPWINVTGLQEEDVVFEITNFNVTNPASTKYQSIKLNNSVLNNYNLAIGPEYNVWKKTNTTDFVLSPPVISPLNRTDTLRFVINETLFTAGNNTLELNFGGIYFKGGDPLQYTDSLLPFYDLARLTVRVWS